MPIRTPPHPSGAGASASAEYARLRRTRAQRARRRAGTAGAVYARLAAEPTEIRNWRIGAEGERLVATYLERRLAGRGVALLHDRRCGLYANIDHIAVGPGGVTVIDAKRLAGPVRVRAYGGLLRPRRELLLVDGHDRTWMIDGLERQVALVRRLLRGAGHPDAGHPRGLGLDGPPDLPPVEVAGAICLARTGSFPVRARVRDVSVGGRRSVAALAARRGTLTLPEIEAIRTHLAACLPPA